MGHEHSVDVSIQVFARESVRPVQVAISRIVKAVDVSRGAPMATAATLRAWRRESSG
jgi:hypothetical protein